MRTLHLYILREFLLTVVMTVMVFCLVLLMGNVVKQILTLLVAGNASLSVVAKAILYMIPYILTYALPFGVVAGALLTFGRLSAENELTAARAGGVSLITLIMPVFTAACLLATGSILFNFHVAPKAKAAYKSLYYQVLKDASAELLVEKRFNTYDSFDIYAERIDQDQLYGVTIQKREEGKFVQYINADEARVSIDQDKGLGKIELSGVVMIKSSDRGTRVTQMRRYEHPFPLPAKENGRRKKLGELSLRELVEEKRNVAAKQRQLRELGEEGKPVAAYTMPYDVQIQSHASLAVACISFTLIGVPLGIRSHRKETSIGIALAVGLVAVFYTFMGIPIARIADRTNRRNLIAAALAVWSLFTALNQLYWSYD